MKILRWFLVLVAVLLLGFFLGPKAPTPQFSEAVPKVTDDLQALEVAIIARETSVQGLKPDNEARIVWADSASQYQQTPYSVVYLHGFSASQGEGFPLHREFAKRYGCNLYLSRLQSHGVEVAEPLLDMTPEKLLESAKQAIEVGKKIGEKVIVMSTSTGGTLALYLASQDPEIHSLICYSPNVDMFDPRSSMLVSPWGLQIARAIMGGDYREVEVSEASSKYWMSRYRVESLVYLKSLVDATMTEETFSKIKQPLFLGYFYKDAEVQDHVVSVPRMLEMYEQLGTPESLKREVSFPDVADHCIASGILSKDINSVKNATYSFAEEILRLTVVNSQ